MFVKKKQKFFVTTESQTFNILITCVISITLSFLTSIFFTFDKNDYTALAFKPTLPSNVQPQNYQISDEYRFVRGWGSHGSSDGQFWSMDDIAVDISGNVFVVDRSKNQIQKFDSNGNYITQWGSESRNNHLQGTRNIAIDSSRILYIVTNNTNNSILKFDSNGNFITMWGPNGTENGEFHVPIDVAVDSLGYVYVVDSDTSVSYEEIDTARIQKFDSNGNFITMWGSEGTEEGQFIIPEGIAIDSQDNVYVADSYNHRIQKFDSNGNFITKWGSIGNRPGEVEYPDSIDIDSSGNVYVLDAWWRIQVFALKQN
jgi:DNA-binding beta-propeller fold protein YncE